MTKCVHHNMCCVCKYFYVNINQFENYYVCGCTLYRKYMARINDVTVVTPDLLLNVGVNFS